MADAQTQRGSRQNVRILVLSASLGRHSLNARLADLAAKCIGANDAIVTSRCMSEFEMPSYDQDVQENGGFPTGADRLRQALEYLFVSEYGN
jgi:chromate reductase, NAD(P)H dehydrogenase (quinone)